MKFVSAQLLAGCILQNQMNGQVIIANTVEVDGRKSKFDVHRDPFGTKEQSSVPVSLPYPAGSRYGNVYPATLNSWHGPKLVIGTQTLNFLVTSFVRLDREEKPSIGAISTLFKLEKVEESLSARIYVDEFAFNKAMKLGENKFADSVIELRIAQEEEKIVRRELYSLYSSITGEAEAWQRAKLDLESSPSNVIEKLKNK